MKILKDLKALEAKAIRFITLRIWRVLGQSRTLRRRQDDRTSSKNN